MSRFSERVAVVTGGASGIGAAVASRLGSEGARVAVWDLAEASNADLALRLDATDEESVRRAAEETEARFGRIDILVTSAGVTGPNVSLCDYPVDVWRRVISINLDAVFYACRATIPFMLRGNWGRIVNIASIAGKEGNPLQCAYSASKAGVIGLTKSLGKELATSGVTCNCVAPAAVRTPLFSQMTPEFVDYILEKIPMGRFGETEEIANLVCWVASQEASFSTGAVFDVSGGRATY